MELCGSKTQKGTPCKVNVFIKPCRYHGGRKDPVQVKPPVDNKPRKKDTFSELGGEDTEEEKVPKNTRISLKEVMQTWPNRKDFWEEYTLVNILGIGGFSKVFEISKGEARYALKILEKQNFIEDDSVILQLLDHKRIVRYHGKALIPYPGKSDTDEPLVPALITEYVEGLVLSNLTRKEVKPLSSEVIEKCLKSALLTLKYIHSLGVVHRDIKPGNIILTKNGPVFIDFGVSTVFENPKKIVFGRKGTLRYMASELFFGALPHNFDFFTKADIFALGVTFYVILTKKTPDWITESKEFSVSAFLKAMKEFVPPEGPPESECLPEGQPQEGATDKKANLYRVVKSMLALEPSKRPSIDELLASFREEPKQ